ncbi:MAG: hypothetical protein WBL63_24930 [Candidatus Acidiferrum sp.]
MLIQPESGYYAIPGVTGTGPCTLSFICGTPSLDGSPHDSFW